jgi:uncharacterized membrane protein YdbT with pleckstrin-like domain
MSLSDLFIQHPGEKVDFTLRRHPLTFVPAIALFLVMVALPSVMQSLFLADKPLEFPNELARAGAYLLIAAYYLGIWLFFFGQFIDYYLDIDIITNDRIIDIEQKGLFGRSISELDLTRVQDVHSEIKGIIATLFSFGNVTVQTAAEEKNFIFHQVPNPHRARQRILELAALDRKREAREIMGKSPEAAAHNEIRRQGL